MQLVVIAREPVPGQVKHRLCPPCTPEQAADIAEASLADTLATVAATPATRRVLALEGRPGSWLPDGFDVVAQRGGGLGNRLFGAFEDCFHVSEEPVVLIGVDTPQVRPGHLLAVQALLDSGADAAVGLAPTGGYWVIGLRHLHPGAFAGVPMSADDTGSAQLARLADCGYLVALTEQLQDVDDVGDARAVAAQVPGSRFAVAVAAAMDLPG
jgi:rSAM/selenodomain-associated transferase 1